MEPKLKKKSLFKRIIKNQLLVTTITGVFLLIMILGSSYALFNKEIFNTENDVIVQSGDLQVVVSSQSEMIEMDYDTLGVSDEIGLTYDAYKFTVNNNGNNDIAYYEIRLVDKEWEESTLPHKSLNFSIKVNDNEYTNPQNLGDNDSYIYAGKELLKGETDTFELKLWVNEEWGKYANNKVLRGSIEVTLYSADPLRNYIIYDTQGGSYVPKTNILNKRISNVIPSKGDYNFIGWSTSSNGSIEYNANEIYNNDFGVTLYALWEDPIVTYNLNGGEGNINPTRVGEAITAGIPLKDGYDFLGWATTNDAEEAEYIAGDIYEGRAITLYAVWNLLPVAPIINESVVAYSVSSPTTFTGGLVAVNTSGTLYNETDTTQTIREYRYSGPTVNNYVYFNCADTVGEYNYGDENYPYNETNCELWRIVGIFKNEQGEWNIKLMRNTVLQASELVSTYTINETAYRIQYKTETLVFWNYKTDSSYNNDWTTAGLQYFLNTNQDSDGIKGYYSTISSSSKSLIDENYAYYLGNVVYGSSGDTTIVAYNNERSETICSSGVTSNTHDNNCNIWYGNKTVWNGSIALLYPSDIGYASHSTLWSTRKLYNYSSSSSSWMFKSANHGATEWLLSPASSENYAVMRWILSGYLSDFYLNSCLSVRPVLNLKSDVKSLEGRTGTTSLPYVFIAG